MGVIFWICTLYARFHMGWRIDIPQNITYLLILVICSYINWFRSCDDIRKLSIPYWSPPNQILYHQKMGPTCTIGVLARVLSLLIEHHQFDNISSVLCMNGSHMIIWYKTDENGSGQIRIPNRPHPTPLHSNPVTPNQSRDTDRHGQGLISIIL